MVELPDSALAVIASAGLAHLVTLDADGNPHVTIVWVGLEDGEIVAPALGGMLTEHRRISRRFQPT